MHTTHACRSTAWMHFVGGRHLLAFVFHSKMADVSRKYKKKPEIGFPPDISIPVFMSNQNACHFPFFLIAREHRTFSALKNKNYFSAFFFLLFQCRKEYYDYSDWRTVSKFRFSNFHNIGFNFTNLIKMKSFFLEAGISLK